MPVAKHRRKPKKHPKRYPVGSKMAVRFLRNQGVSKYEAGVYLGLVEPTSISAGVSLPETTQLQEQNNVENAVTYKETNT